MPNLFPSRDAAALEAALSGKRGATPANLPLLGIADELRTAGVSAPTPIAAPERREELRQAVLARRAATSSVRGPRRARGAVLGIAVVAGAGLVVASAATSANPVVLVADVARELPVLGLRSEPPRAVAIEGEVLGSHDGGRTLEVRSAPDTIVFVEAPQDSRNVTSAGTAVPVARIAEGSTVRVTTDRKPESGVIPATKIEILPTAASNASVPPVAANVPADTKTPPSTSAGLAPAATVRPDMTRTPTTSSAPKPAFNTVATVPALDPVPTEMRTPEPDPKRTPASSTTHNDSANEANKPADSTASPLTPN